MSPPSKRPARASSTPIAVPGMVPVASRNVIGRRSRARSRRRRFRSVMTSRRAASSGASAWTASSAAGVHTSA